MSAEDTMSAEPAEPAQPAEPATTTENTENTENTQSAEDVERIDAVAALTDGVHTLLIADFADTDSAMEAYELLKAVADGRTVEVEGAVVVSKSADGALEVQHATDHSTRRGATWGAVGGAVLGLIFPPSIIGSAVVVGLIGAAVGKGRNIHHRHQLAEDLAYAIDPGHSGLVALVSNPEAEKIVNALAKANRIVRKAVDDAAVDEIRSAAKDAEREVRES